MARFSKALSLLTCRCYSPQRFELALNLKTAKALGIDIPQSIMLRADQVIE